MGEVHHFVWWFGKRYRKIEGVKMHDSGEATTPMFLSRKDGLVHRQQPGIRLALGLCGQRYNIYRRAGMRGVKGIPSKGPLTCLTCIGLEDG